MHDEKSIAQIDSLQIFILNILNISMVVWTTKKSTGLKDSLVHCLIHIDFIDIWLLSLLFFCYFKVVYFFRQIDHFFVSLLPFDQIH